MGEKEPREGGGLTKPVGPLELQAMDDTHTHACRVALESYKCLVKFPVLILSI